MRLALFLMALPLAAQTLIQQNFDPRAYDFTRTNGSGASGDLSTAGAKTAVLSPCPKGFNSNAVAIGLKVRISGGTGTAEQVALTSYTAGTTTCTVGFTTSNVHTGSWVLASATAGIGEAANMAQAYTGSVTVPMGTYTLYAEVPIKAGMALECSTQQAILYAATATQNIFTITTTAPVRISNCTLDASTTKTAGAAVQLNGNVTSNRHSVFDRLIVRNQYDGIDFESGIDWVLSNSYLHTNSHYDIIARSTISPQAGDSSISNVYADSSSATANVLVENHSGLKVVNSKFLNAPVGVDLSVVDGYSGVIDLLLANNSLEGHGTAAIRMGRKGPANTGYFSSVLVTGNELSCGSGGVGTGILATSGGLDNKSVAGVTIEANNISFCTTAINAATDSIRIANNMITLTGVSTNTGIVTTGATHAEVMDNQLIGVDTPYTLSSGTTLRDMALGIAYASLPSPGNGSQVYCSNCNSTCTAGGSSGRTCFRENGAWTH